MFRCKMLPYWLGTFLFDFTVYLVTLILSFNDRI